MCRYGVVSYLNFLGGSSSCLAIHMCDTPMASVRACLRHRTVAQCTGLVHDLRLCLKRRPPPRAAL